MVIQEKTYKELPCRECGKKTEVGSKAKSVLCEKCTNKMLLKGVKDE